MRKLLHILLMTTLAFGIRSSLAQSSNTVRGKVTDFEGSPIPGASVAIKGGAGTIADDNGMFSVETGTKTLLTIIVSSSGYKENSFEVRVTPDLTPLLLKLEKITTGLDAIIVTATNRIRTNIQTPISISVMNDSDLQRASYSSQADILRNIPGITTEGGGGEVAANVFVRGLPSGGQFAFTPLELDGMPVISTMGLNSSAPDVYFRMDEGINNLEFARGGAATLHGMGSVAGIINYNSKVGTDIQKTILRTEWASPNKIKLDFNVGGPLSENGVYYNITGTYRYDKGPIISGNSSNGYQVRANIKKIFDRGSFTVYGQYIDDKVQFYSPYHLTADRKRPQGWDGQTIYTMQTDDVAELTAKTPDGIYKSKAANGAYTKGGYLMTDFVYSFGGGWKLNAKLRTASYYHEFNLFNTDGTGRNPLSQNIFFNNVVKVQGATDIKYAYADDNTLINPNALILENVIVDRIRPLTDAASTFNFTKSFKGENAIHTLTLGTFFARTTAGDLNVQMRYLSEFNKDPKLVNLTYKDNNGDSKFYTVNGLVSIPAETNKNLFSNKSAAFITDELVWNRFNIDLGFRVENQAGGNINERRTTAKNADGLSVNWGNGGYDRIKINITDWAFAIGLSYKLTEGLYSYGNFSRGYFFPAIPNVTYVSGIPIYPNSLPERVFQREVGMKLLTKDISATVAFFYVNLKNRRKVFYEYVNGVLDQTTRLVDTKSYGVEITYNWGIIQNLSLSGSATYQAHKYTAYEEVPTNVGNWLERQPRLMINDDLNLNISKFDASIGLSYRGKRFGNASNVVKLAPYTIARLDAGYKFNLNNEGATLRLSVGVFNLLNEQGITEGNPRAGDTQLNTGDYFVGRPILPRAIYTRLLFSF